MHQRKILYNASIISKWQTYYNFPLNVLYNFFFNLISPGHLKLHLLNKVPNSGAQSLQRIHIFHLLDGWRSNNIIDSNDVLMSEAQ